MGTAVTVGTSRQPPPPDETSLIPKNECFATHIDPSTGDKNMIYGRALGRRSELDGARLPLGATEQGTSYVHRIFSAMLDV